VPPDVREILSDPRYVVVPAAPSGPVGTMAWLRASVSRFCSGADHARRRALVEAELARLDPAELRARARHARPTCLLAEALGVAAPELVAVLAAVETISPFYLEGAPDGERARADVAVATLVQALGPDPETAVPRIAILVQAHTATESLIRNALALAREHPLPVDELLERTLRERPPVPGTRRVAPDGRVVTLDFAEANRDGGPPVTFGWGPRACPGAEHALALAAGAVEAALAQSLVR
jgi:cytochrome P450